MLEIEWTWHWRLGLLEHNMGNCHCIVKFVLAVMQAATLCLTHWGRMTHICFSKITIIGSDNGLSPGRRQAIIWTNAGILLIEHLGTNFSENLVTIHTFSFKKMHLNMPSGKWRPFCLGLNMLILDQMYNLCLGSVTSKSVYSHCSLPLCFVCLPLHWRHNGRDCVSNHQPYDCLLNRLFRRRSKKTSKLRVTGLCEGKSTGTGEFPAQMASNAENVSIWWRHHAMPTYTGNS